jgi:hypothetical protein
MPKRKEPEPTPKQQFDEFLKTARELGVDEKGEALADAFKKLAPKPKPKAGRPRRGGKRPSA